MMSGEIRNAIIDLLKECPVEVAAGCEGGIPDARTINEMVTKLAEAAGGFVGTGESIEDKCLLNAFVSGFTDAASECDVRSYYSSGDIGKLISYGYLDALDEWQRPVAAAAILDIIEDFEEPFTNHPVYSEENIADAEWGRVGAAYAAGFQLERQFFSSTDSEVMKYADVRSVKRILDSCR